MFHVEHFSAEAVRPEIVGQCRRGCLGVGRTAAEAPRARKWGVVGQARARRLPKFIPQRVKPTVFHVEHCAEPAKRQPTCSTHSAKTAVWIGDPPPPCEE